MQKALREMAGDERTKNWQKGAKTEEVNLKGTEQLGGQQIRSVGRKGAGRGPSQGRRADERLMKKGTFNC